MNVNALTWYQDKLITVWVGPVMFPGKLIYARPEEVLIESHQHKGHFYVVDPAAITAISGDDNMDTVEKWEAAKKEAEEKQRAAAAEYRRMAEELAKGEKQ